MTPARTKGKKPKPVKAWAIVMQMLDGTQQISTSTNSIKGTRREAIQAYRDWMSPDQTWKQFYREGDRAIRVLITPLQ